MVSKRIVKALEKTVRSYPRHDDANSLIDRLPWLRDKLTISEIELVIHWCGLIINYKLQLNDVVLLKRASVIIPKRKSREEIIEDRKDRLLRDLKKGKVVV